MKLKFISDVIVQRTKNNIVKFKDEYVKDECWINNYYKDRKWEHISRLNVGNFSLMTPDDNSKYDLENTRIVYDSMKNLKPYQATDERIWSYLTHIECWDYMRKRWPAENYIGDENTFRRTMKERYFLTSNSRRALMRNGISRLWWYGYLTYDEEDKADPYKLTEVLLKKQDIPVNLFGRNFSNSPKLMRTVLRVLDKWIKNNGATPARKPFRKLCRYINHVGGVSILDSLKLKKLEKNSYEQLEFLSEKYR
jgi:hypothetical protein